LRDVPFNDYPGSALVAEAVADMNNLSFLKSNKNISPFPVTPQNLFRGQIINGDGNVLGPYISQFMVQHWRQASRPIFASSRANVGVAGVRRCVDAAQNQDRSEAPGTMAEMAKRALKGAWFHKWIVDLRLRPEEYGGLVLRSGVNFT